MKTIVQRTLPLAVTMLVLACADLAMESDRIPESMEISTNSVLITKGETTKLDVVVRDQNGEVMELPSWAPLEWRLEDPAIAEVALDGTVSTLRGGETRVWVSLADLGAAARVRVNPDQVLLSAPLIYVTQSTQNHDGDVRLVAGRRAMVRVFMVGNETSFYGPGVRIRVLLDGDEIFHQVFPPVRDRTPEEVIESEVDGSVNAEIPGSVIRPGIRMVVELDPEGVVPLAPGSQLRYPAEGSIPLQVVELQPFRHVIVPTVSPTTGNTSVVSWANTLHADHPYMSLLKSLWPISGTELEIHETYSTSSIDTFNGWFSWLADIRTIFHQEGRRGYYYGATHQSAQGLLGVGYFGVPASIGVNRADTHTHEVGHNHQAGDWTFDGTVEVTVNLFTLYVYDFLCEIPMDGKRFHGSHQSWSELMALYDFDNPDFEMWKREPFLALIMYAQMQQAFGWDAYRQVFTTYRVLPNDERPKSDDEKRDQWLVRFSRQVGRNLGPFFEAWGVPTSKVARDSIADLPVWLPPDFPPGG